MSSKRRKPVKPPACIHCGELSRPALGAEIYPRSPDIADLRFFKCDECDAFIGTLKVSGKPLGLPANKELREIRKLTFDKIKPIYQNAWQHKSYGKIDSSDQDARMSIQRSAKKRVYMSIAANMGIPYETCKVTHFGIDECREAYRLALRMDYGTVRAWYKEVHGKKPKS